jgi:Hydroxyethylthiazole kinase family
MTSYVSAVLLIDIIVDLLNHVQMSIIKGNAGEIAAMAGVKGVRVHVFFLSLLSGMQMDYYRR